MAPCRPSSSAVDRQRRLELAQDLVAHELVVGAVGRAGGAGGKAAALDQLEALRLGARRGRPTAAPCTCAARRPGARPAAGTRIPGSLEAGGKRREGVGLGRERGGPRTDASSSSPCSVWFWARDAPSKSRRASAGKDAYRGRAVVPARAAKRGSGTYCAAGCCLRASRDVDTSGAFFPSPLAGEGAPKGRMRGWHRDPRPSPAGLRPSTFSRKGKGKGAVETRTVVTIKETDHEPRLSFHDRVARPAGRGRVPEQGQDRGDAARHRRHRRRPRWTRACSKVDSPAQAPPSQAGSVAVRAARRRSVGRPRWPSSGLGGASAGGLLSGGIGELIDRFRQAGHGETANSGSRPAQNREVAPHQLEQAIGPDVLDTLTRQTGLSRDELLARLSREYPRRSTSTRPRAASPPRDSRPDSHGPR